jgi:hypothetical protein
MVGEGSSEEVVGGGEGGLEGCVGAEGWDGGGWSVLLG